MMSIPLPEGAREKLMALQLQRGAAEDAERSASARLQALPRDADQRMRERLADERDKHNARFVQLSRLLSAVQQWLTELRPNFVLEVAAPVDLELKDGQTLSAVIEAVRTEIAATKTHLQSVRAAPLPLADQKKLVEAHVKGLAQAARPSVAIGSGDKLRVGWRGDMANVEDVMALLCWVMPQQVIEALSGELPERPGALPANERLRRIAEAEAELDGLERREESLIERAAGDGLDILRRHDASPAAVLGVAIAGAQQQIA
jgi:hypothetical protein